MFIYYVEIHIVWKRSSYYCRNIVVLDILGSCYLYSNNSDAHFLTKLRADDFIEMLAICKDKRIFI